MGCRGESPPNDMTKIMSSELDIRVQFQAIVFANVCLEEVTGYMAYCGIMRVEKRKRTDVYGLQIEANRTVEDHDAGRDFDRSDIDWDKTNQNIHLAYTKNWNDEITRQIKEAGINEITKGKKRSVVLLDALYTASPEWFDEHQDFEERMKLFTECLDFHVEHYCSGDRKRLLNAVVHVDETSWHMQVASIPIINDGEQYKLSAKIIMGNRSDYRRRQDQFYEEVTQKYGLDRGELVEYEERVIEQDGLSRLILSRAEDAKLHTTKREWELAQQEELLQRMHQEIETTELEQREVANLLREYQDAVEIQEKQLKRNEKIISAQVDQIESRPHILTKKELEKIKEYCIQPNKITGKVTLDQTECQSLVATALESEKIREYQKEIDKEKDQIKRERMSIDAEREDIYEQARKDGMRQGIADADDTIIKAQCYDQMVDLVQKDNGLKVALKKALNETVNRYPELVGKLSEVFGWAKEMVIKIKESIKMSL